MKSSTVSPKWVFLPPSAKSPQSSFPGSVRAIWTFVPRETSQIPNQLSGAGWEFSAVAGPGSGRREELFCLQSIKDPAGKGALLGYFQVSAGNWKLFGKGQGGSWDLNFV